MFLLTGKNKQEDFPLVSFPKDSPLPSSPAAEAWIEATTMAGIAFEAIHKAGATTWCASKGSGTRSAACTAGSSINDSCHHQSEDCKHVNNVGFHEANCRLS